MTADRPRRINGVLTQPAATAALVVVFAPTRALRRLQVTGAIR
jgi:hypothetical protein